MVVAELFVNLGIKGADKTFSAMVNVQQGLKGMASTSLEAKAAIIGAMYALEQLFAKSGAAGTGLTNFSALVGMDTKTLQQYQYAARQMGVTNEETAQTFKTLQENMTKISLGQGTPALFGHVSLMLGSFTDKDIDKFMKNPELLLQKLQDFAQKEKRIGIRNQALSAFGVGPNMSAALARGAFKPQTLSKAPIYGEGEIRALDRANIAWSNLNNMIQMAIGHINAAHGGQLVKDFGIIVNIGFKIVDVILKIVEKIHLFEAIDNIFIKAEKGASALFIEISKLVNLFGVFIEENKVFQLLDKYMHDVEETVHGMLPFFTKLGEGIVKISENLRQMIPFFVKLGESIASAAGQARLFEHFGRILFGIIDIVIKVETVFSKVGLAFAKVGGVVLKVADQFRVFEGIAKVISFFLDAFEHALGGISFVLDKLNDLFSGKSSAANLEKDAVNWLSNLPSQLSGVFGSLTEGIFGKNPTGGKVPESVLTKEKETSEKETSEKSSEKETIRNNKETIRDSSKESSKESFKEFHSSTDTKSIINTIIEKTGEKPIIFDPKGIVIAPNLRIVTPNSPVLQQANAWVARPVAPPQRQAANQTINVDQTLHFPTAGREPKQTGNAVQKAVNDAFRLLPSQGS